MADKNKRPSTKLFCRCGCGIELNRDGWAKYSRSVFVSGHNVPVTNSLSLIDKTKDTRKNQTGYLATKVVANIKHDAIKAGYAWELTPEFVYYKIIDKCTYCGKESGWPKSRNGIDRVNSLIGYTEENCVTCCKFCNRAKSNSNFDDFYEWVNMIYNKARSEGKIHHG